MRSVRLEKMLTGSAFVIAVGLIAPLIGAASPAHAAVAPCTSADLTGSVIKMNTLPGGTTVTFALKNTGPRRVTCRLSGPLSVQFLSSSGAAVGRVATSPSLPGDRLLRPSFQARASVSTMEGVLCTSRLASAMRISWSHLAKVIHLGRSIGVCVNGTTRWTTVSSISFP